MRQLLEHQERMNQLQQEYSADVNTTNNQLREQLKTKLQESEASTSSAVTQYSSYSWSSAYTGLQEALANIQDLQRRVNEGMDLS